MFKVTADNKTKVLKMCDLEPCQLAVIVDDASLSWNGCLVMRTACPDKFEVMNLSHPKKGNCWSKRCVLKVNLLPKGTKVTLEVV